MINTEIHREIWQGRLPLCFRLNQDDVIGIHPPEPYFMMASRKTYFPLVLDRVIKYFIRFVDQTKEVTQDMWLDFEGQPIKWHLPIGLSWDLYGTIDDLPWKLILHFSDFPSDELVRCNNKTSIESNFMSTIKEADGLKHKGSVMRNLVKKECNQLWSGLMNDKFDQFWQVNKKLMEKCDNELFKSIPFRLYLPDCTYIQKIIKPLATEPHIFSAGYDMMKQHDDTELEQLNETEVIKFVYPINENKGKTSDGESLRWSTILDLVQICFKDRLNDLLVDFKTIEHKESNDKLLHVRNFRFKFITHGIELPLDAPLQWLSENLSYPDNFLNICAVFKDRKARNDRY